VKPQSRGNGFGTAARAAPGSAWPHAVGLRGAATGANLPGSMACELEPHAVERLPANDGALLLGLCLLLAACRPSQFESGDKHAPDGRHDAGDAEASLDAELDDSDAADAELADAPQPLDAGDDPSADAAPEDGGDAGDEEDACAPRLDGGRELVIAGPALELARLGHPASVSSRKLGPSAWLGAHRVWSFSETALVDGSVPAPGAPVNYPSAALDGPTRPWLRQPGDPAVDWRLAEELTSAGAPQPLLTREPEEIGLVVTSIVKTSAEGELGGLAFVRNFTSLLAATEVWVAELDDGATLAMRDATPLFVAPEPLFALGAQLSRGYVKLFACTSEVSPLGGDPVFPCVVARVPVERAGERAAYEAYAQDEHGAWAWSADLARATPVLNASDVELSVSWNEHLERFVAVHSAYFSNDVVLHTAPEVEGPWTEGVKVTLAAPPVWPALYAREHPGLQQQCGRRLIISHWAATGLGGNLPSVGDVVLGAIDLE
jgi:hypothetical protein